MKRSLLMGCAVCALLGAPVASFADEFRAMHAITVSGLAKRKVVPDEAHITINLNAMHHQLNNAKQKHDEKLHKLMRLVEEFKIDKKKVSTQSSNVQPVYDYVTNQKTGVSEQVFKGYRMQTNVDVTVQDTSRLAQLMDAITKSGFDKDAPPEWGTLLGMYYTLSDPDKLHEEMLAKAVANARMKADKMANAAQAKVGKVIQINESGAMNHTPVPVAMFEKRAGIAAAEMSADAGIAPPAGEQELQATVTVTYELE